MRNKQVKRRLFFILLAVSLGFFLVKGVRYALIGSYVPLLFIVLVGLLFFLGIATNYKVRRRTIRFWAVCLLLWSVGVLFVEVSFQLLTNITETHIRDQFTILQNGLVVLFMFTGAYLIKNVKQVVKSPEM